MRHYETMVIVSDLLDEEAAQTAVDRIKQIVADQGGVVLDESFWGKRPLAYEIDHRRYGYYLVLDLEISAEGRDEFERQLQLSDDVVRFKTVRPDLRVRASAR